MKAVGFEHHDHNACMTDGLKRLESHCHTAGLRATPVRKRVLEILLESHRALGAYDILDQLREEKLGSQPPIVYRALEFLHEHGFIHRVERLNAFIACADPEKPHSPVLLICDRCRAVAETEAETVLSGLAKTAAKSGFEILHSSAEAIGICPNCRDPK